MQNIDHFHTVIKLCLTDETKILDILKLETHTSRGCLKEEGKKGHFSFLMRRFQADSSPFDIIRL